MAKLISADLTNNKLCILEYTTTDGQMLSFDEDAFDAKIVSHTYTDIGKVIFDKPITGIGERAFYYCDSLTSVTIPNSVTTIGECAFAWCTSLTSVTIPNSVTMIGGNAFDGCRSLKSVAIGSSVTTIGGWAFAWCTSLTSVTIPDSITTIGSSAFFDCRSLTSVTIPDSVTTIGSSAFFDCRSLKEFKGKFAVDGGRCLIMDGVLNAFALGCGVTQYTIPDSVTTIGDWAFWNCSSLTSVTIPDSVTTIGKGAFSDCESLTSVTIPDSVTTIGEGAFADCESLKEFKGKFAADGGRCLIIDGVLNAFAIGCGVTQYTIPDSVTTIEKLAFYSCSSLTSVTIGKSVSEIGKEAYKGCNIDTIVCYPKIPPKINDSFDRFENLIVPTGCEEAYANSDWGQYLE